MSPNRELMTITVAIDQITYSLLEVLTKADDGAHPTIADVIVQLIDHVQQGIYRPGSWERGWLEQIFPCDWQQHLEPGDPYGRPDSPMFQRPKRPEAD